MIDFNYIPLHQEEINQRLEHWAKWVSVKGQAWKTHPMFRQYRSHAWQWHPPEIRIALNTLECAETERQVSNLPVGNREALRWCYVFSYIPVTAIRKDLGVTREQLGQLIIDGRDMLSIKLSCKNTKKCTETA